MPLTSDERAAVAEVSKQTAKWVGKQEFSNVLHIIQLVLGIACFAVTAIYIIPGERQAISELGRDLTERNNVADKAIEIEQTKQIENVVGLAKEVLKRVNEESKIGAVE